MLNQHYKINGKTWRVASVHNATPIAWVWLVNIKNENEQARFPLHKLPEPEKKK